MIAAGVILLVLVVGIVVAIALAMREWVVEESRVGAHLADPLTHTVSYAIPEGLDPVVLKVVLGRAGFASMVERVGDRECIRVECAGSDRATVRRVLESIHPAALGGSEQSVGSVVFEDER